MRLMTQTHSARKNGASFEDAAADVMGEVQGAFHALVESLPGTIRRAVDLERTLRLERKQAWRVFRLSRSSSLAEVANVPSLSATTRLIDAADKAGVDGTILARVRESVEQFEDFVEQYGGDRAAVISMASGASHEKSEQHDLNVRKTLFRAQSHVWGVQSRMQLRTNVLLPMRDGGVPHVVVIGYIGLQKTRQGSTVALSSYMKGGTSIEREPVTDPEEMRTRFNMLPEFCSQPMPQVLPEASVDGTTEIEMVLPSVGVSGAATIYMSQTINVPPKSTRPGHALMVLVSTPAMEIVNDVLVPVGWTEPSTARVAVYGRRLHPEHVTEERKIDLLPQRETVAYMGVMEGIPVVEGAPRHHEAVRHVLKANGALGMRFDVYRCRVQYPALHSLVAMRTDYTAQYMRMVAEATGTERGGSA